MKVNKYRFLFIFFIFIMILQYFSNINGASYSTYINGYPVTSYTDNLNTLKSMSSLNDGEVDINKSVKYNNDGTFKISLMAEGKKYITNLTDETEYNIVFIIDNSGSMYNVPSRIEGSTEAVNEIIRDLSDYSNIQTAVVAYSSMYENQPDGTLPAEVLLNLGHYTSTSENDKFIDYVATWDSSQSQQYSEHYFLNRCLKVTTSQNGSKYGDIYPTGGTFTQAGIIKGYEILNNASNKNSAKPVIILMSDGEATGMTWTKNGDLYKDYQWEIESIDDLINNYDSDTFGAEYFTLNSIMPYVTIRTAIYLKDLLKQSYEKDVEFYTFGYDIPSSYYYAQSTLNPTQSNVDALKNFMSSGYEKYGLYSLVYNSGLTWDELMYTDGYYSNGDGKKASEIYNKIIFEDSQTENSAVKSGTYLTINDVIGDGMEISQSGGNIEMTLQLNGQEKSVSLNSNDGINFEYKDETVDIMYNKLDNELQFKVLGDYLIDSYITLNFDVALKNSSVGDIGGKIYYTNSSTSYSYETSQYNPKYMGANIIDNIDITGTISLTKLASKVIVKYVDDNGNELLPSETKNGYLFDPYTTEEKTIDGYVLYSRPYNSTGTFSEEDTEVIYKYKVLSTDEPNVTIDKNATWVDIEEGIAKITLKEFETVEEQVDTSDYLIVYDVSGSMPIVTVNGYEPGTYNIDVGEVFNIGCKNPNHYSVLKPGYANDLNGWRNAYHYDNNGTPNDKSDDLLLNYTSNTYKQTNWKGDVVQTFNLSASKDFMYSKEKGCYSTLDTSQEMINKFVDEVLKYDSNAQFGYVAFAGDVIRTNNFTTGENLKNIVNRSTQYGGTVYAPPLKKAEEILATYTGSKKVKVIFITDGENYDGETSEVTNYANNIRKNYGAEIYTVSVDYDASTTADIRKFGDKYIYLTSDNLTNVVNSFIDYSLNRSVIKATDKVFTDKINSEYFDVLDTNDYKLPENVSLNNNQITWNIPDNQTNENQDYEVSFYIKLKDEYRKTSTDTNYKTNIDSESENGAVLTYKISGGYYNSQIRTVSKESPELPYGLENINATKLWGDYNNNYNTRPNSINLVLNKNDTEVDSANIIDSYNFPGYKIQNGNLIVYGLIYDNDSNKVNNNYTITESKLTNYDITQMGNKDNSYTVVNTLNIDSKIQIRYVDTEGTNLADIEVIEGKVGEKYETTRKPITNYRAYGAEPENANGNFDINTIEIVYVYEKIPATLKVEHVDKLSGEILDTVIENGFVGESITTSSKDFNGYILEEVPETENYIFSENEQTVTYYYTKLSNVTTKYIDINTGKEIDTSEVKTYKQNESYTTIKKDIIGYTYVSDTNNTNGIVEIDNIEVIYYYKKDTSVTVKHVDKMTGEALESEQVINGLEGDPYTSDKKEIAGYVFDSIDGIPSGNMIASPSIVTYYYLKQSDVVTKYIDINTGNEIESEESTIYKQGDNYTTIGKDITGYTYVSDTNNTTGIVERDNIEVIYYYKRNTLVVTKYIDKNTGKEIANQDIIMGLEGDEYIAVLKTISGYNFVENIGNTNGNMLSEPLTIIFYYIKQSGVTTKYIDINNNTEIADSENVIYYEGENYSTVKKEISDYTYVSDTGNISGMVGTESIEVIYYYKKNTSVAVKYIDINTNEEIASTERIGGLEGDTYTTEQKEIERYKFIEVENSPTGTMSFDPITVTYKYIKQSDVNVLCFDENTGALLGTSESVTYSENDPYTTQPLNIDGYTLVSDSGNTAGIIRREDINVKYYYRKNTAVTAKYIDMMTNEEIEEETIIYGLENDEFETVQKEINGYEFVEVDGKTSGKMEENPILVTYKYKKLANLITEHIDLNTNEKIVDNVVKTYKEGDTYEAFAQDIEGYILVESPESTTEIMEREDITKTFYYKKISAGLVVKYVDKLSGELLDYEEYTGNEKDIVTLVEKSFEHYVLDSSPDFTEIELTVEPQEVIYYYIRIARVPVEGIDQDTREVLYTAEEIGLEGEEYTTIPKEIDSYVLVKIPENQNGIYERENSKVTYEYKRIAGNLTVKYIDKETGELLDSYEQTGLYGDNYKTEIKIFEKYNLVEIVGDEIGILEIDGKEVIYYYEKKKGDLVVRYIDTEGNEILKEEMTGKVDEEYKVEEKEVEGYKIIKRPEILDGVYKEGTIELLFVLEKVPERGTIIVNFVDKDGNVLAERIMEENIVGEELYIEAPEIKGYRIVSDNVVKATFVNGELIFNIIYEKIPEPVNTGDINVLLVTIIAIISIVILIMQLKRMKHKD